MRIFFGNFSEHTTYLPQMGAKLLDYKKEQSFLCDISIQTKHTPQNKGKIKTKDIIYWYKYVGVYSSLG